MLSPDFGSGLGIPSLLKRYYGMAFCHILGICTALKSYFVILTCIRCCNIHISPEMDKTISKFRKRKKLETILPLYLFNFE